MSTLCLISIVNAAHTLHFGAVMAALWAVFLILQSIMLAQPDSSAFMTGFQHFPPFVVHMEVGKKKSPNGPYNAIMGSFFSLQKFAF